MGGYRTRALDADTSSDFARLVEANNGLWGARYPGTLYSIALHGCQRRPAITVIAEKHRVAMVPTLGELLRGPLHHNWSQPRHGMILRPHAATSHLHIVSPDFRVPGFNRRFYTALEGSRPQGSRTRTARISPSKGRQGLLLKVS